MGKMSNECTRLDLFRWHPVDMDIRRLGNADWKKTRNEIFSQVKEKRISPTTACVGSKHHDNCMWSSNTLTEQIYSIKFIRNSSKCGEKQFKFKSCNTCDREKIDRRCRLRTPFRRTNNVRNLNWTRVLRGNIFISAPFTSNQVAHRLIFISCDSVSCFFIFSISYIELDSYYIFPSLNFGFGAVAPKKQQMHFISRIKTVFFIGQHSVASVQPLIVGLYVRKWQSPTNHSPVKLVNIHLKVKK